MCPAVERKASRRAGTCHGDERGKDAASEPPGRGTRAREGAIVLRYFIQTRPAEPTLEATRIA